MEAQAGLENILSVCVVVLENAMVMVTLRCALHFLKNPHRDSFNQLILPSFCMSALQSIISECSSCFSCFLFFCNDQLGHYVYRQVS